MSNSFNRKRIEIGLTRPEMLEELGAKSGRLAMFSLPDDKIDPIFHERANALVAGYRTWKRIVESRLSEYEGDRTHLTMDELCDVTGLRFTAVAQLRTRGTLEADRAGHEYVYPISGVRNLLDRNSTILSSGQSKTRGPLSAAFLRWFKGEQERRQRAVQQMERELSLVG